MGYTGADDPQLLSDLRAALRCWHGPALCNTALATHLTAVACRMATDPGLSRGAALQGALRAALAHLRDGGQGDQAELLEQHYLRGRGPVRLGLDHHLSERSVYYRLHHALAALAQAVWHAEQSAAPGSPSPAPSASAAQAELQNQMGQLESLRDE
jgi:hypothetical protein